MPALALGFSFFRKNPCNESSAVSTETIRGPAYLKGEDAFVDSFYFGQDFCCILIPLPYTFLPMNNLLSLSAAQLNQAAQLKEKITQLEKQLNTILGASTSSAAPMLRRRPMSAAAKARIAAAAKARWARVRAEREVKPTAPATPKKKSKMSAEARAKIAAAVKARWAKIKAAKQS